MTSHVDPYSAAGIPPAQSEKVKQSLAKAKKAIQKLADIHASDEQKFKKELSSAHAATMGELEDILGKVKASELVRHFLKPIEGQSTPAE